ncbi:MotA/TolQ/ExbB proton channel family protein [Endozoicomonas ascidiicola]|uniref:MotA/TolQ/ExbB proton channel family protein n=1 Tax=Endozoicomonas ascidiicola TaxID=1698521 RepID=UPI000AD276B8|nr:MotA/TolQ/ExbB proton channel family protein [Endozoicomonas ascidiicola]
MKHKMMASILLTTVCLAVTSAWGDTEPLSMDSLLHQVKSGINNDRLNHDNKRNLFQLEKSQQEQKLAQLQEAIAQTEKHSRVLETQLDDSNDQLEVLNDTLTVKLGTLKELFGSLQQVANETRGDFKDSITQVQFPERDLFLSDFSQKMGEATRLPDTQELEQLWFELQREMVESGKVRQIDANDSTTLTRIGLFNIVQQEQYLQYIPATGQITPLSKQPATASTLSSLNNTGEFPVKVAIDPTRGQLLELLMDVPELSERIKQGGIIGYFILGLGLIAFLLAAERTLTLVSLRRKVSWQKLNMETPLETNPLGRLILGYQRFKHSSAEAIEMAFSEILTHEIPALQKRLTLLKTIAVVSPLLGLLGTVTGMIVTFQAITLFGTGDPRMMAGGISQALVTTVMGLTAAIPAMLLHSLVSHQARTLSQTLEEYAASMITGSLHSVTPEKQNSPLTFITSPKEESSPFIKEAEVV